jgi:protoheme IX farnesyltransferase
MSPPGFAADTELGVAGAPVLERSAAAVALDRLQSYLELMKLRVNLMVLLVTAVGFVLGAQGEIAPMALAACLLGTALLGAGASALNQLFERRLDARMARTRDRPLPSARVLPWECLVLGLGLAAGGVLCLWSGTRGWTAALGTITFASYVFLYTPLKRVSPLSLYVGAVPGALPPIIGWSAAGPLPPAAWAVFAVLFIWQIPHFAAIGWLYRDDYGSAGFPILAVLDRSGRATARLMVGSSLLLIVASLLPVSLGLAGWTYFAGAVALGAGFLSMAGLFGRRRSAASARRVLQASLIYLPVLFLLLLGDSF